MANFIKKIYPTQSWTKFDYNPTNFTLTIKSNEGKADLVVPLGGESVPNIATTSDSFNDITPGSFTTFDSSHITVVVGALQIGTMLYAANGFGIVSDLDSSSVTAVFIATYGGITAPNYAQFYNDSGTIDWTKTFNIDTTSTAQTWIYWQHTTQYPTLTPPSSKATNTNPGISALYWWDSTQTFNQTYNTTFDRGSINPQYEASSPYRSGPGTFNKWSNNNTNISFTDSKTWSDNNDFSWPGISANWSYTAGPQPTDSDGNPYDAPYPAGNLNSNTTNSYSSKKTLPYMFGLTSQVNESALIDWSTTSQIDVTQPDEDGINKQVVYIPSSTINSKFWNNISKIQQWNPLSQTWDDQDMSEYTITKVDIPFSNGHTYNTIEVLYNGPTIGTRQLRYIKG